MSLFAANDLSAADATARRAIQIWPHHGLGWKALGTVLIARERFADALPILLKATQLLPADAESHNNLGSALQGVGRPGDAAAHYRRAIELNSNYAIAYRNLANVLRAQGRLSDAEQSYRRALELTPRDDEAYCGLAKVFSDLGRFAEAESELQRAIALRPDSCDAHTALGYALQELGRLQDAEASFRRALDLNPNFALAHESLGNLQCRLGELAEAEASHRRAIKLAPASATAHYNIGIVLTALKRFGEAEASYRRAISLKPDYPEAHNNLGNALYDLGRVADAEREFRRAAALRPGYMQALSNLGIALHRQGRLLDSVDCYHHALKIQPNSHLIHSNLGNVLRDLGRPADSEASFRQALALRPDDHVAYCGLGAVYRDLSRFSEAEQCFRRGLEIAPDNDDVYNNLGTVLGDLGRLSEAERCYRRALELKPGNPLAHSNLLFLLSYFGTTSAEKYLEEARTWETRSISVDLRRAAKARRNSNVRRPAARKLRLGYVSGDFRAHPVAYFLERVLQHHDRHRFEVFAYTSNVVRDATTERLQGSVDAWRVLVGMSDDDGAQLVLQDEIDVLIDLSGHTAHNRLGIFARRAAPVQCEYLGYFASTGLSEMDYVIADPVLVPEAHDKQYCEQVWRLPRVWVSYAGSDDIPIVERRRQPGRDGKVWLGSFNHLGKITERTVALWARVLKRVPNANLCLKTRELEDVSNQGRILAEFGRHGIPKARIKLLGRTADWAAHMAAYNTIDVVLDPVGAISGATTTCDALWMGVPVVTLAGGRYGERQTCSMLAAIGRSEWATADEDEYVEKVAHLAVNSVARKESRSLRRDRMRNSPLADAAGLARALEDAYAAMIDRRATQQSTLPVEKANGEALYNHGNTLYERKQFDEALASYDKALAITPAYAEVLNNRGNALQQLGRRGEALASYDRAVAIRPDYADALNNRGLVLHGLKRHAEALASFDRVLALKPGHVEALCNRGSALHQLERYDEALVSYNKALAVEPGYVDALYNRGLSLHKLKRYDEALASFDRVIAIKPSHASALSDRGLALQELKRYDEALASYDSALAIQPDYAHAHFNESLCRLQIGDYERGWEQYEWRWKFDEFPSATRAFKQALWLGEEDISGKSILLHSEQGLGDTLQFVRYAPLVAEKGASVLLEVPKVLVPQLGGLAGISRVLAAGDPLPETEFHAPLLSLPLAFKTTLESIPASIPYLSVKSDIASERRKQLTKSSETLVGLCWRGNPGYRGDRERSIQLAQLIPFIASQNVRFISLQKELDEQERGLATRLVNFTHLGEDFERTAEIVAAVDLVITVDTAWAHWAGAIGKPVWVLLPFSPHWVWLIEREDSPWYPTARLFRQTKIGDWGGVVRGVKEELAKWLDTV